MKITFQKYLLLLICTLFITSCKVKKTIISYTDEDKLPIDSIYKKIFSPPEISWLSGRAKFKVSSPYDSQKAVMFLRMKSDSIIWASFKKIGAEGARALITKDSIFTINRIEKTFQKLAIEKIYDNFGLSPKLMDIQDLIKGNVPKIDTTLLWQQKEEEKYYTFRSIKDDIVYTFRYDKFTGELKNGEFIDRFNLKGFWNYDDYRIVDNITLPYFRKYTVQFDSTNYINLTLEFTDLEINKEQTTRFPIPTHYTEDK